MPAAVLDPGVLVSALISPTGAPAKLLARSREGEVELIASPHLLGELEGVLRRKKFRPYATLEGVASYLDLLHRNSTITADPQGPPLLRCADPDDEYLIALAHANDAALVSGDKHLLDLADKAPIHSPADFLSVLDR